MVPTLVLVSWFAQFKIYTVNVQALMYILTFWFSDYFKTPGHYFHCFLITPVLKKNFPHLFYLFKTLCHKNRLYQVLLNLALRKSQETSFFLNNVSGMYRNNFLKKKRLFVCYTTRVSSEKTTASHIFFFTVTCLIYQHQPINEQTKCSLFWWFNKD